MKAVVDVDRKLPQLPLRGVAVFFFHLHGENGSSSILKEAVPAKSLQSCPTLRDPVDCSLPGSSVHGIFQARVLEWGAIAFSLLVTSKGRITVLRLL